MKLINTTNSHSQLVKSQLESTDASPCWRSILQGIPMLFLPKLRFTMKILISNKTPRYSRNLEIEAIQRIFLET